MKTRGIATIAIAVALSWSTGSTMAAGQDPTVDEFLRRYEAAIEMRYSHLHVPKPTDDRCLAALPLLHAAIREGDSRLKARSVRVLGWMYPLSDGSSDVLISALQDEDAGVREEAAVALGRFLPDAPVTVPHLERALTDSAPSVQEKVASSLGQLGPTGEPALQRLNALADASEDALVRAAAVEAIVRIDPRSALKRLGRDLESHVTEARIAAAWSIRLIRGRDEALETIAQQLIGIVCNEKSDQRLRDVAFETIGLRLQDHPHALDALASALAADPVTTDVASGVDPIEPDGNRLPWKHHYPVDLARQAISAVQEWSLTPGEVNQLLKPGIMGEGKLHRSLVSTLVARGEPDEEIIERLLEIMDSSQDTGELRIVTGALLASDISRARLAERLAKHVEKGSRWAISALGQCGPESGNQVEALAEALRRGTEVKDDVIGACVGIGSCPPALIPELLSELIAPQFVDTFDFDRRVLVAEAIAAAGEEGVKQLIYLLWGDDHSEIVRRLAVMGIGAGGSQSAPAIPMLIDVLRLRSSPQQEVSFGVAAEDALARLCKVAAPHLARDIRSPVGWKVANAVRVFEKMGPRAAPWGEDIVVAWHKWTLEKYEERRGDVRSFTGDALISIGGSVVPALLSVCEESEDPDHLICWPVAEVLKGMSASELAPHLDALTDLTGRFHDSVPLRQSLAIALGEHPSHPAYRKKLLSLMRDPEYDVRDMACVVVRQRLDHEKCREAAGWCGDDVVGALAEAVTMKTPSAFEALAKMGPSARAALPALLAIAEDPEHYSESDIYLEALMPIAAIGPTDQGLKLILEFLLGRPGDRHDYLARFVMEHLPPEDAGVLMRELQAVVENEENKEKPDQHRIEAAAAALSSLETLKPPHSIAWLSDQIAKWVDPEEFPDTRHDLASLLQELAAKNSTRGIPAIRLAAMSAPQEEARSLARTLLTESSPGKP